MDRRNVLHMNKTTAHLAQSVQNARQSYWAAVACGNAHRAELASRGLAVAERMLIASVGGSIKGARTAELAHIASTAAPMSTRGS
jgi:hypothetical protein